MQYISEFLFGPKTAAEALKNIIHYVTFYKFEINTEDGITGLVVFFFIFITVTPMAFSLLLLRFKIFDRKMNFLSSKHMFYAVVGSILIMSSIFTLFGEVTGTKCHLRLLFISMGFTLSGVPILCQLIVKLPYESNKVCCWFTKHIKVVYIFLSSLSAGLNVLMMLFSWYTVEKVIVPKGKNFKICSITNTFGKSIFITFLIYLAVYTVTTLVLVIMDLDVKKIKKDLKHVLEFLFSSSLCVILLTVPRIIGLNDHLGYNIYYAGVIYLFALTDYLLTYGIKIFQLASVNNQRYSQRSTMNSDINFNNGSSSHSVGEITSKRSSTSSFPRVIEPTAILSTPSISSKISNSKLAEGDTMSSKMYYIT